MSNHAAWDLAMEQLNRVLLGKNDVIRLTIAALLADGHVLLEDRPGMGKTSLAHGLAQVLGLDYRRIQCTNDMLPADLMGMVVFDDKHQASFRPGPLFTQMALVDELNRASPRTQSALLEAMEERQISIEGISHQLPQPFFVIATQNPLEQAGTSVLPESQLDRFLFCLSIGYPDSNAELQMLQQSAKPLLRACISHEQLLQSMAAVTQVKANSALLHYVLALVNESRTQLQQGLSPRASRALLAASKAWAWLAGRDYVIADDVQAVFVAVAAHRLTDSFAARETGISRAQAILASVDPLAQR